MENRLTLLKIFFIVFALCLVGRLFYWQAIRSDYLSAQAYDQHQSSSEISAPRGNILARDGTWLVATSDAWLVYVNTHLLDQKPKIVASMLAPLFIYKDDINEEEDIDEKDLISDEADRLENLLDREGFWIPLKQKVNEDTKKQIQDLDIAGIGFEKQEARTYPEASNAAQLLGFVGKDDDGADKGYFGLEGFYDLPLSGKPGFMKRESDARGIPILFGNSQEVSAIQGGNLITNIDKTVQLIVEDKLRKGIETYGAVSGKIIVMNPQTGAIMAMASFPSYDPRKYWDYSDELFKNPIISDAFEPGSIFKPIVMASGLDAGVVTPDTICDICDGPYKVDKYYINTWNSQYFPNSTMTDVIKHSDNVGMTFVSNQLGSDRMYDYLSKFGFGRLTNIDLQGEAKPILREKGTWNIVDRATTSFGQGIAVTPIQMISAMAIIANGGVQVQPQVVDKIESGDWEYDIPPQRGERVISEQAAKQMKQMMVTAVNEGEAKWTILKDYTIAGKTGTAQIPVAGHYDAEKTNASFIGFAPVEDPQFLMLVTLQEPSSSPWAAETAAPLWFNIAKTVFPYLGIRPDNM